MAHLPVNHPARPFVRLVAGGIGLYILAFGVLGFVETRGESFFAREETWALGLRTNPAFSILSIVAGAVLLGGALIGRNVDHYLNLGGGVVFLVAGFVMMLVLRTDANMLNFAMPNVIVSFLIGVALLHAGLYGKTGPPEMAEWEEHFRHSESGEPTYRPAEHESTEQQAADDREASEQR